jgi:hypothetical protein
MLCIAVEIARDSKYVRRTESQSLRRRKQQPRENALFFLSGFKVVVICYYMIAMCIYLC